MPIPAGTKFHGVAPSVDTTDRGSATVQTLRDAYTIEQLCEATMTLMEPYFQTATPGGSDTYTANNNIVDFTWVGGSGTYDFVLPSAAAVPYRAIRFVNDSTVAAADKVHIVPPAGETIDGGAFYEINKPYNGCMVWSDGTEWIVIQAKST